jgi:hypothetical protein
MYTDLKKFERALRLRAPKVVGWNFYWSKGIFFDANVGFTHVWDFQSPAYSERQNGLV